MNRESLASRTALIYAVCAALWIVLSDQLLDWAEGHSTLWNHFATFKGLAFVGVTALTLYIVLSRLMRKLQRAETAVRAQEARWRLALDGIGDGMWDWEVPTGQVFYSPGMQAMLGYAPGEFSPTVSEWESRVHPDDIAAVHVALERHFWGETPIYESEHRILCKDGHYLWVLDRGVVTERKPGGAPLRMVGTHSDIHERKELETTLKAQSERYEMLFDDNPHPMWIFDTKTLAILMVNDAAVKKYGYAREAFLQKTILDLRPPEEVPALLRHLEQQDQSLQASGPWKHRLADGQIIVVEIHAHSIIWEGRAARVVVAHDVSAQQRAVHEIEESEKKFRAVFESANDAIIIADERFRVTDCNQRAREIFRSERSGIVGHQIPKFFPKRQPDGSRTIEKALRTVNAAWEAPPAPMEWLLRRPDGTLFSAEITVSGLLHDGQRSIVVVARDITERKRAVEQMQLLQEALRATPAGIIITAADGTIDWVNPAFTRISGYTLEETIGRNPRVLRSGEHDADFYRRMWDTIRAGNIWSGEIRNRRKDGTTYEEHMTIAPVRNAANVTTHFIAVKEDITEQRRLEQQLARGQRLESVGMLASGIAHDLNNVLTPIILTVDFLRSTNTSRDWDDRLGLVAQAAQRGASIVKQVLTFARGVDGERTAVSPRYVVKELAQLAEETFPRNIEIHVHAGREIPDVLANVTQLHQVLLNLAVNARDAMPSGGRLDFGVHRTTVDEFRAKALGRIEPGEFVDLSVRDTGTGMSEEVIEHMFEPFFTTKPRGKGTGLGLSTVYGIVRSHGGAVEVETALGHGTTFHVLLPVPRGVPRDEQQSAPAPEFQGRGRLVLLVDDEESIRIVGEHALRRLGFEVVTASDGVHALRLFQLRPRAYALALVDQMMPRMGGVALIRELRALNPELKIISSTGLGGEPGAEQSENEELSRLGVSTRLPKPYSVIELQAVFRRELGDA